MRTRGGCRRSRFRMHGSCEGPALSTRRPCLVRNCARGAGTHTPRPLLLKHDGTMSEQNTAPCGYGSLRSQGRRMDMASHSRGAMRPSCAFSSRPKKSEGAGKAGCWLAPAVSRAKSEEKTHTSIQVSAGASGLPCAMVLRLMPRSPWRRIRLASIAGELAARIARLSFANLRRLDTSHGCQDHTVLPYATAPFVWRARNRSQETRPAITSRARRFRVHRSPGPTFVTIAIRPSCGPGWRRF